VKLPLVRFVKAHHISRAALCAGVLAAAVVFFAVGAGVRLLIGPVSLGPLRGTLAGAIHSALPGIRLEYDQAAIEWSREDGRINLVVLGTRLYDSAGHIVAQAPKADIDLAAAPFLSGHIAVRRITLVGVQLTLVHLKDGGIRLGLGRDKSSDDLIRRLRAVIEAKGGAGSTLQGFAVRDAHLAILDETSGLFVIAPKASLTVRARGAAIVLAFDADTEISGRRSHVAANLLLPPGAAPFTGDLSVSKLDLRALAANAPRYAVLKDVPLSASAAIRFTMKRGGVLEAADFDVTAEGNIPVAVLKDKALHVEQLRLTGHYRGEGRRLTLKTVDLTAREGRMRGRGGAELFYAHGALDRVRARLAFDRIAVDAPGLFAQPVGYRSAVVEGEYQPAARRFEVSRFSLAAAAGFALTGSGALSLNDSGAPGLSVHARIAALPVRTLLRFWPLVVAPGAREWIDNNIFAGTVGPLEADGDFAPGVLDRDILPEESVHMTFAMQDVEGSYIKGLTHATGVAGNALLTGDTFRASFSGGRIGPIQVSRGTALIPNLHKVGTVGSFGVHVDGAMPDIMRLIDMAPLNYARKFGVDPGQTGGTASADLSFDVPMLANLPVDDVGIAVKAQVNDFSVTLGRIHVHDGAVAFDIDNDRLHQTGTIGLADSRMAVDWTEDFKTKDAVTTRLAMTGNMTEAVREHLGLHLQRYFRGTVPVTAQISGHRGALIQADVGVDFTPALLSVPIVNLEKAPGQAASGRVVVNFGPGNTLANEVIHIGGPVLNVSGTAIFTRSGELASLSLPSIKMGTLNDLSFQLDRGPAGNSYVLRGHSLDGSRIGRNGTGEGGRGAAAPADNTPEGRFRISVALDRLAMRDGVSIAPFNMDLTGVGDRPATLAMNGALVLDGAAGTVGAAIGANIAAVPQGRRLTLTADDAGLLARGLFAFESMRGGKLTARAVLPGRATDGANPNAKTPDFSGILTVTDFRMVNQSLLARLFSAGSLTGLGDLMGGEGMTLDSLDMPFSSRNNVISVRGARVAGPAIGASADGYIDRPKSQIALKGSLVPAFGLNSIISNVPVLGDILASKKGEGIFGVTYSLSGDAEHPAISTNPLSMLTPGILRRIFEGHIPTAANAPSNVQKKTQTDAGAADAGTPAENSATPQ
jgi:hypothetical protein